MEFLPIDHQAEVALIGNHRFKREPPDLADTIGKCRRNIDGEGNAVPRQDRIGPIDQVLVAAVECQADKPPRRRQRHRPPAHLVDRNEIEVPALQGADGAIEEFGRDLTGFERLEPRGTARADPLEPQHDAGDTGPRLHETGIAAEVSELQSEALQKPAIRWQFHASRRGFRAQPRCIVITLC